MKRYALLAAASSCAALVSLGAIASNAPSAPRGGGNTNASGARLTVAAIEGWSGRADLDSGNGTRARLSSPFYGAIEATNSNGGRVFLGVIGPQEAPLVIEANSSGLRIR